MALMNQGLLAFVTILGVMEILCNLRLVLEGKTGKEIPELSRLEFLEKVLANNFALSNAEDNTCSLLNRVDIYSRFTFIENTISNSPKVLRATFLGSDGLFVLVVYASLAASRTLLQQLLACLNFTLDSEDLFCWYK